jgi:hypothetical protein
MSDQSFSITSTYNPSTGTITCSTSSVTIGQSNTGKITVNLQLSIGSSGSIAFQSNPVTWSTTPPASFNVQTKSSTQIFITAPNGNSNPGSQSYSFQINYTYTPTSGPAQSGTGDPSIILEGTGANPKDHASEQGKTHGKGV